MPIWRNRLALVKIESTYGTNSTPAATDALLFTELGIEPASVELVERETIQSYMGSRTSVVAQVSVPVTATVELATSGTLGVAPRWAPLLRACGMSESIVANTSVTYAPVSSSFPSYTMDFFADTGSRQAITGIRGSAELSLEAGSIPTLAFTQMGIYTAPDTLALPSPTYSGQAAPVVVNSTNTTSVSVHGVSACMSSFSLSLGVEMVFRQLAGCTREVLITSRATTGSITIELPTTAALDLQARVIAQTTGAISWQHGPAGNRVTFTASTCAFDSPTLQDQDGVTMVTLPFRPLPTSAGNNEFSLALT